MGFFTKTKKNPGWMAIGLQADGVCVAHVTYPPASKPVVERVAFYPADAFSAVQAVEKLSKELHAHHYQCTTVLEGQEYQLLSVDAPTVPLEELKTAIRWRLKDMLDFPIDDATIDVLDVPVDKAVAGRNKSMYAVAARNPLIQQRQNMFLDAKVPLSVIDIPEMAQRNVSTLLEQEGRGVALLSFDSRGGLLTVSYAGELYLSRRIDVSLAQLQLRDTEQRNACYDRITLELQRSLDHFDRQYHFINVAKLVLAPAGEAGHGLQSYLATNLYIPVENLDLGTILDLSKVAELHQSDVQQRYFMSIGAAMRREETVL